MIKGLKLNSKIHFPLSLLIAIFLIVNLGVSCDGALKEKYLFEEIHINDTIIKEENNLQQLQLDIDFPSKYKNKLTYIQFQPLVIMEQNDTIYLNPYKIQGEKIKDNCEIVSYENGKTIQYIDKFKVEPNKTFDKLVLKVDFMYSGRTNLDITGHYLIHKY